MQQRYNTRLFSITARPGSANVPLLLVLRKVGQRLRAGSAALLCLLDDERFIFFKQSCVKENVNHCLLADDMSGEIST